MTQPTVEVIPLRTAVRSDAPVTLDVLLRITPPRQEAQVQRPALNVGLVLDRSGSMMEQNKMTFAREAAVFAVQQLLPSDRVSVTVFDHEINTLVPSILAENKPPIIEMIRGIVPRNQTDLHGGWKEGGAQVRSNLIPGGLNRVLLLSDGLANVGVTNPDVIATNVLRLAKEGVSTTAIGLGDDYNENLLEAMAQSGDGNYYYIESPNQLPPIFSVELTGLMATLGQAVSLGVEPSEGVTVVEVLNDFDKLPTGRCKLPNLVTGMPILVVLRLQVSPMSQEAEVCRFRLAWKGPDFGERQRMHVALTLPVVDRAGWDSLAETVEVQERVALLLIARLKKLATRCAEIGDPEKAKAAMAEAKNILAAAPSTPEMAVEAQALNLLENHLASGASVKFSKHARYQSHQRSRSTPYRQT